MKISLMRAGPIAAVAGAPGQLPATMQDEAFAELLRLTAKLFQVPVAVIALPEDDIVRMGCTYGLGRPHTEPREVLGPLALLQAERCAYENLHAAPCALLNPVLAQQLHLGFYASHTLRTTEGQLLGALCLLGYQPRAFCPPEARVLAQLAALVLSLLDLHLLLFQQPSYSQQLWRGIYGRIRSATQRLKTLAALARWEDKVGGATSQLYQSALYEEILHVIGSLADHLRVFQS